MNGTSVYHKQVVPINSELRESVSQFNALVQKFNYKFDLSMNDLKLPLHESGHLIERMQKNLERVRSCIANGEVETIEIKVK